MTSHRDRMAEIGIFLPPPRGTAARRALDMWVNLTRNDPRFQRFFNDAWARGKELVTVQQENGAGLETGESLREFAREYNGRAVKHGIGSMPSSFNVLEAFVSYIPPLSVFALRPEFDHIFGLVGFLDFVTGSRLTEDVSQCADLMRDGVIYSYLNADSPDAFTVSTSDAKLFGLGGVSLIRHGNELSILLVAGEMTDTRIATESLAFTETTAALGREQIRCDPDLERRAVPLMGIPNLWRVLAIARLDLETRSEDARYLLWDLGDSYLTLTDDVGTLFGPKGEPLLKDADNVAKMLAERIKTYASLFEFAKSAIWLPLYFEEGEEDQDEEKHRTKYGERPRSERRRLKNEWPVEERISERRVRVLQRVPLAPTAERLTYQPPDFHVETSGYWKGIAHDRVGADKHGRPIHGKTWVEKRLAWRESDPGGLRPITVVSAHATSGVGWIYIMRSAMHPRDVFKVGHTARDPDIRAGEVSRGSGVPDGLFPMYEWKVIDSESVEHAIHQRLASYRLSDRREFFQIRLPELVRIIEEVITGTSMPIAR